MICKGCPSTQPWLSLQVLQPSPQGDCGKMHELLSLCRQGTVIRRMLTHYWLFFSLQTPLRKPDLQDPRGSFLWPLQPEDSVSSSLPSAETPKCSPPPAPWHWPCTGTCSHPEGGAKLQGGVVSVVKPTLVNMPLGEWGAASHPKDHRPHCTASALLLQQALSRSPPEHSPPCCVKTHHRRICRGSRFAYNSANVPQMWCPAPSWLPSALLQSWGWVIATQRSRYLHSGRCCGKLLCSAQLSCLFATSLLLLQTSAWPRRLLQGSGMICL